MTPLEWFESLEHFVYDELEKANPDFSLLLPELAIFHRVQVAQGVIDKNYDVENYGVIGWDDSICGDECVYPAIGVYASQYPSIFQ